VSTMTTPAVTTDKDQVDGDAIRAEKAEKIDALARTILATLTRNEHHKHPSARTPEKTLWNQARREAASQLRREAVSQYAKEHVDVMLTSVKSDLKLAIKNNRKQLMPWAIAAPYAGLGAVATASAATADGLLIPAAVGGVCAGVAALGSVVAWKRKLADAVPSDLKERIRGSLAMACCWSAAMPLVDGAWQAAMWMAMVGGTAWVALPWWRRNTHPIPLAKDLAQLPVDMTKKTTDENEDEDALRVRQLVEDITASWYEHVSGDKTGAVPEATLEYDGLTGSVLEFVIELDPQGQVTAENIETRRHRIAQGTGVFARQLTFEQGERVTEVIMRVQMIEKETRYEGPVVLCDGKRINSRWEITPGSDVDIVVGPYLDGQGATVYRVISAGSVNSAFILGSIGSGKTLLAEQIAIGLRFIGCEIWYVDGQDGASSDMLKHHASWSVPLTQDDIENLYQAIGGVMKGRNLELRTDPELQNKYTYDPKRPPVIVFLEEAQEVFRMKNENGTTYGVRLGYHAQKIRKNGIGFVAISQDFDMVGTFGGSDLLRNCITAGHNFFAMMFTSSARKGMLPGDCPDLTVVPPKGYGYSPMGNRPRAMWRAANIENSSRAKHEWMQSYPEPTLDLLSQRMAGKAYKQRHIRFEENLEDAREQLDFLRNATDEELEADRAKYTDDGTEAGQPTQPDMSGVVRFPGLTPHSRPTANTAHQPPVTTVPTHDEGATGQELTPAEREVFDCLDAVHGHTPTSLSKVMGKSSQLLNRQLKAIVTKGYAYRDEEGVYRLVLAGADSKK
jgi:hypothetical protein